MQEDKKLREEQGIEGTPRVAANLLSEAEGHFANAARLQPSNLLFQNNLGVSLLNQGKARHAADAFREVLHLHKDSFATVKGLDPEASAHLNLGAALVQTGDHDEAHEHWLMALHRGNYESAQQAMMRMVANKAQAKLPCAAQLDLIFGESLAKAGRYAEQRKNAMHTIRDHRCVECAPPSHKPTYPVLACSSYRVCRTREAAISYVAAYTGAEKKERGKLAEGERERIREDVRRRMHELAQVWDDADGALPGGTASARTSEPEVVRPKVNLIEAGVDGATRELEVTPEMLAAMQAAGKK